ncbi:MAG: glycosyltransferase [Bacteroidetes bacterium]|nr:glycosyltransferase [Bacteroidota bacterium]
MIPKPDVPFDQPDSSIRKVLICPLDWGIGHATRCIPVIQLFQDLGFSVIVAGSGRSIEFIKREHPKIRCIDFPGIEISYPRKNSLTLKFVTMTPRLLYNIFTEHRALKRIVRESGASLVISDNRYGCWHSDIPSVFITHQLNIQIPSVLKPFGGLLKRLNYFLIHRYTECWIPDFEPHRGLAGLLSHPKNLPANCHYIGILSRFERLVKKNMDQFPHSLDILVMLSGPEPQRTMLEEIVMKQLAKVELTSVVVRGITDSDENYTIEGKTHIFAHLETPKLYELLARASLVICRSGYSSIMDLVTTGKQAVLIPTPGQTEQEYLARYLMDKKIFFQCNSRTLTFFTP